MIFLNNPNGIRNPQGLLALSPAGNMGVLPSKPKMLMATASSSLKTLREQAADCRACPLWKGATQTVFGEGPQHAQVILVGEQPGGVIFSPVVPDKRANGSAQGAAR